MTYAPAGIDPAVIKARTPKRLAAAVEIELRTADGAVVPARLYDFSKRGFGVECHSMVLIGSTVELLLPTVGWVKGTVRWSIGNRLGGWFNEDVLLDPSEVTPPPAPKAPTRLRRAH